MKRVRDEQHPRASTAATASNTDGQCVLPVNVLGFPFRTVCGPMVGASDLAFRLLCRRHGADLCYTEMIFASRFVDDPTYRMAKLQTCAADRPLVVQFAGNEPETLAAAAALATPHCDAIDLNLGCPLPQAAEGGFGAYLSAQPHWDRLCEIVRAIVRAVQDPMSLPEQVVAPEASQDRNPADTTQTPVEDARDPTQVTQDRSEIVADPHEAAGQASLREAAQIPVRRRRIIPVLCKIRLLESVALTIDLCLRLQVRPP
jgi:hypothetical protein